MVIGWGMKGFEFIFLARKWNIDRSRIVSSLNRARKDESSMWLVLFPEGTVLCKETMDKSIEYAKKSDITFTNKHTLLPKCTGLFHILRSLQSRSEYLFDYTIGYSNHTSKEYAFDKFSLFSIFCEGRGPAEIHMHVDRFKIADIPGISTLPYDEGEETSPDFEDWLYKRFEMKDQLLADFYEKGHFPPSRAGSREIFEVGPLSKQWVFFFAFFILLATWGYFLKIHSA
jgi:1-acyl-sn-glycerol-3-phosphate acyltransferase